MGCDERRIKELWRDVGEMSEALGDDGGWN